MFFEVRHEVRMWCRAIREAESAGEGCGRRAQAQEMGSTETVQEWGVGCREEPAQGGWEDGVFQNKNGEF
jgi:hypothetical protein